MTEIKSVILIAEGFEEIETVSVIDLLRRGGLEITSSGFENSTVRGSHGIVIETDSIYDYSTAKEFDALIFPGGLKAVQTLAKSQSILDLVNYFYSEKKNIAAICAAPLILDRAGILQGKSFTCHPSVKSQIHSGSYSDSRICLDGSILTSQGPGTVFDFALSILEKFKNKILADEVAGSSLIK
ncbi:DJ-1/PfpI family protein [candidate division WOR-3 bacterium]|nr:DJ-1/PfpI family protein [candidate division WOR-3 bacterium]